MSPLRALTVVAVKVLWVGRRRGRARTRGTARIARAGRLIPRAKRERAKATTKYSNEVMKGRVDGGQEVQKEEEENDSVHIYREGPSVLAQL